VLAYLAARELGMGRPARLVVAVMFALASTPVSIALTVRAYSLATMLTLAAFVFVLRILRDHRGTGPRERWGFVVAAVLASWTEYSAVLTVLAMAAGLAIHALRDRELRMAAVRGAARPSSWGPRCSSRSVSSASIDGSAGRAAAASRPRHRLLSRAGRIASGVRAPRA
jgi:uncharacterized membrane protein